MALRIEARAGRQKARQAPGDEDLEARAIDETSLSRAFDRSWALALIGEAVRKHARGGEKPRRGRGAAGGALAAPVGFHGFRHSLMAKLVRAKLHAREGRLREAGRDIEDILRAAALLQREGGLLRGMVGSELGFLACRSARFVASRTDVPPETVERLLRALGPPSEEAELLAAGLRLHLRWLVGLISQAGAKGEGLDAVLAFSSTMFRPEGFEEARRTAESLLEGHPRPFDAEDTVRLAGKMCSDLRPACPGGGGERAGKDLPEEHALRK